MRDYPYVTEFDIAKNVYGGDLLDFVAHEACERFVR
jgi:hypothetical protein